MLIVTSVGASWNVPETPCARGIQLRNKANWIVATTT